MDILVAMCYIIGDDCTPMTCELCMDHVFLFVSKLKRIYFKVIGIHRSPMVSSVVSRSVRLSGAKPSSYSSGNVYDRHR